MSFIAEPLAPFALEAILGEMPANRSHHFGELELVFSHTAEPLLTS
jgi:hypothetical protein